VACLIDVLVSYVALWLTLGEVDVLVLVGIA
jgi:hypothetical protein